MSSQQNGRGNTPAPAPANNVEGSSEEMNNTQGSHHSEEAHPAVFEQLDRSLAMTANMILLYDEINTYNFYISSRLGHANQSAVQLNDIMSTLRHQQEILAQQRLVVQTGGTPRGGVKEAMYMACENRTALRVYRDIISQFIVIMNDFHMIEEENEEGLSEAQLQSLPTTHISIQQVQDDTKCNVCLMDYTEGETVCQLSCSHLYHTNCITRWLTTKTTCPTCRRNLKEESTE